MASCSCRFAFVLLFSSLLLPLRTSTIDFACDPKTNHHTYAFCNTSLSGSSRAESLLSLLTLREKISQLSDNASGIPRLGIPPYEWWSESLHGIAPNGPAVSFSKGSIASATVFPQVILMASSFNRTLWFSIASAIAVEARAMYNQGQAGLTFWAPNVNIFRDPRWGRGQETPGEDPFLTSIYATEFVRGIQGGSEIKIPEGQNNPQYRDLTEINDENEDKLMISACCKHLTAYDLEKWGEFTRYNFNAVVTERDMFDTYQPPFRRCVEEGKASCLMCSYNAINGIPSCANQDLLRRPREEWRFKGYMTSDCDAVATIFEYQNYSTSAEDAVAIAIHAGLDTNCGTYAVRHLESAIRQGKMRESDLDPALLNLFTVQMRLGLFDGDPKRGPFGGLGPKDVCSNDHQALALDAARQGIVLLKNDDDFLPLNGPSLSSIAIIGPAANASSSLLGDYSGNPCSSSTYFQVFGQLVGNTYYALGCEDAPCESTKHFDAAIRTAASADVVVLIAGNDVSLEGEDNDRVSLLLPGKQMELVNSIAEKTSTPIILVLTGGGPMDVSFAKSNSRIACIIWVGYPGEKGPEALKEIIFGEYNPGGRLTMTWYPEAFTEIPMNDMSMRSDDSRGYPGRSYRFYNGEKVYEFGDGLSYGEYSYEFVGAPKMVKVASKGERGGFVYTDDLGLCGNLRFSVSVSVRNSGEREGSHVVMMYGRKREGVRGGPLKQLVGFERVHTVGGGKSVVSMVVDPCANLGFRGDQGKGILPLGEYVLLVGDSQWLLLIDV